MDMSPKSILVQDEVYILTPEAKNISWICPECETENMRSCEVCGIIEPILETKTIKIVPPPVITPPSPRPTDNGEVTWWQRFFLLFLLLVFAFFAGSGLVFWGAKLF
ncbi:MAG: hypothetical protein LBM75_04740 [Myxococcales bacterium]|nr:hypothetical protein [Myxococcales bacterium]